MTLNLEQFKDVSLKRKLKLAIEEENYELAQEIHNEIKKRANA